MRAQGNRILSELQLKTWYKQIVDAGKEDAEGQVVAESDKMHKKRATIFKVQAKAMPYV